MAIEEPAYELTLRKGAFEIRDYPALVVAEVSVGGERSDAASAGFRLLAAYVFGANARKQNIAMTAPVVQAPAFVEEIAMTAPVTQTEHSGDWVIRFIMPRGHALGTLPAPSDTRVTLMALPPARVAVLRFAGRANDRDFKRKTGELGEILLARHLRSVGPAALARYNPPWIPGFLRRNEVMLPLQAETTH
jgi:hypothetical protein